MTHQVLLVEDDIIIQHILFGLLRSMGYVVILAEDVAQAQVQLRGAALDLVLLDMILPDGNGLDILAQVQHMPDPPLVLVTTVDNSVTTVIQVLRNGAFDYLTKPLNIELVRKSLQRAAEHITLRRAAAELAQLQAQELAMQATARAAVHHLSQDMTVIMGEAQLLQEELTDPAQLAGLERIVAAVTRAAVKLSTLRHARRYVTEDYAEGDMILDLNAATEKGDS